MSAHSAPAERRVLAIDPGRMKCGLAALILRSGRPQTLRRAIVDLDHLATELQRWIADYAPQQIVIGDGTEARRVEALVKSAAASVTVAVQDEENTTLEARRRYFDAYPPRGWRRWLPLSLQVPPAPVDDFAAVILGERFLAKCMETR